MSTTTAFAQSPRIPRYLRVEQEKIERLGQDYGLDFFPIIFEMVTYDQMNEIAAYGGFPNRYPHWRFGMEYERLAKSSEYGLSKIYELVINNNPSIAYLLEGNSLTDQKLVMCHVLGHVDFFKNNFMFRATDLDAAGPVVDPSRRGGGPAYDPNRKWIDKMANHGAIVRRLVDRHGIEKVESFVDHCLSLENLIDPWAPFVVRSRTAKEEEEPGEVEVPRLRAKEYMESFINPEEYLEEQKKKIEAEREQQKGKFPKEPSQDVLSFLLANAPLERWERSILEVIRSEAYYFLPQIQTKIMNEGWASYWHSRLMTEKVCDSTEILDYADNNAAVMATSAGQLNPYKLGVELFRDIEERWDKGQFGREWEDCDDLEVKKHWDLRLGLGRQKLFEVRAFYNDVTFIDEFLTPEFAMRHKLFTFEWASRSDRFEIESREFRKIKDKLLFQLTNRGNPYIFVEDANFGNRGELLLRHQHAGVDLRADYARETLAALVRVWKRPVCVQTVIDGKKAFVRFDGKEHTVKQDT
ncbi:MAG TPA: SpoVR family protein [Polyangiaceae bacterium]|nr:SpoVR family protein [Polyangiaceae bacterium]